MNNITFPSTIKSIAIYNASFGTRELARALLDAIHAVYATPQHVTITSTLDNDRDDILYIVICPAGFGASNITKGPKYYINYQLEPTFVLDRNTYLPILSAAICNWDYCQYNVQYLTSLYNINSLYLPIGYTPCISTNEIISANYMYQEQDKDVDVLFLGYCEAYPRRLKIRDDLYRVGLRIWFVSDFDLTNMQQAIKRARICLNIHNADNMNSLETIRLNILLSNYACIVSEEVIAPERNDYKEALIFTPYKDLVGKCLELKWQSQQRLDQAVKSYQWYSTKRRWNDLVDFTKLLPACDK